MEHTENNSGQGKHVFLPESLKGWNWGAFALNWIWGLAHNTWISLLALAPIVVYAIVYSFTENDDLDVILLISPIMSVLLGIKGNEWAWQNKKWKSEEHFKASRKKWNTAAIVILGTFILMIAAGFFMFMAEGAVKE